ncbi:MAG: DUF1122 family protein [Candidatus Nanohaloarchaea archaeon]
MPLQNALATTGYELELEEAERHSRDRFVLRRDGSVVGRGTWFRGTRHIAPWIELQADIDFDPDSDRHRALFDALAGALAPGGHVMVHYLQDTATAEALTADVPPPATPIGFLLWQAGCRWFKDWYFTEGWMEGDQKLQGNLPVDADHRRERERETAAELEEYLSGDPDRDACKKLAERVLDTL